LTYREFFQCALAETAEKQSQTMKWLLDRQIGAGIAAQYISEPTCKQITQSTEPK